MTVPSIRALEPLVGMSHTMLNRHFRSGKFAMEPGGGFDPDKVATALNRNRSVVQPSQAKGVRGHRTEQAIRQIAEPLDYHEKYNRARALKEERLAAQADLDLKERIGELVESAEVEKMWGRHIEAVKNRLLLLESKVPPECRALVAKEIRAALAELAEYRDAA